MTEALVPIRDATLWTRVHGSGPPLVLLHGGPGANDYLDPVAAMLDDLVTVHRYEQRGCGRSTAGDHNDVATNVADLEALREHWGHDRWIVMGHSWGAALGLAYALDHPDRVVGLGYLAGIGIDRAWRPAFEEACRTRRDLPTDPPTVLDRELNRVVQADWTRRCEDPELIGRVEALDVPAVLVHGTADLRPSISARRLAELLPRATFVSLPDADHVLWLSHPDATCSVLREIVGLFAR